MMQNEPLRLRLVELHGIYLTPSPADEMAREVGPPEFVFLPDVGAHVTTGQTLDDVSRGTRPHIPLLRSIEAGRHATANQVRVIRKHFGVEMPQISVTEPDIA